MIEVTTDFLCQIIGAKEVELVRLRLEVNRLTAELEQQLAQSTDARPETVS